MFKKSRLRIILSIMAVMVLILGGTFAVIYGTSYARMASDNRRMLEQYAREYSADRMQDESPEAQPDDIPSKPTDGVTPPENGQPPHEDEHKFDVSTFYSVAVSSDGTVIKTDNGSGTLYSDETLEKYAEEIIKNGSQNGTKGSLSYLKTEKDGYTLVCFIDNIVMQGNISTLFTNTLIFGGISLVAVFFASVFLAKRIVSPLEESYEKQKQFISDAGHELKTPVSVVGANAEILEREIGNNKWLENIKYENGRMGALVKQLLELARTENVAPNMQRLDLSRLVSGEALPFESVAFENGLELTENIADGIFVNGDEIKLKQLSSILIDNAVKHSENGKSVNIKLTSEHGYARLSVVNDGREIPQENRKKLFERFYREDEARNDDGHFGLGLAIAKAIAVSHKGKIGVSCYDGKVEFTVTLPLAK